MQPDLAAFASAIEGFRQKVGVPVIFLTPLERTYPPGTILDPETGRPYDPTIEATGEDEFVQAEVTANLVVDSAVGTHLKDTVTNEAIGMVESGELVAIVSPSDFEAYDLEDATRVVAYGDEYEITEATKDSVGGAGYDRVLMRGRQR